MHEAKDSHEAPSRSRSWRLRRVVTVLALGILALPVAYVLGALALMYLYFGGVTLIVLTAGAVETGLGNAEGGAVLFGIVVCLAVLGLCLATLYGIWIAARRLLTALRA